MFDSIALADVVKIAKRRHLNVNLFLCKQLKRNPLEKAIAYLCIRKTETEANCSPHQYIMCLCVCNSVMLVGRNVVTKTPHNQLCN